MTTPKIGTAPPRGMRDLLPPEVELRDLATQRILAVYRGYGFRRIETPALENLQLLAGGEAGENETLIFKVLKRGEDLESAVRAGGRDLADLGLRFDLTVPLARYYAEHHARLPNPLKAIQIGPVWRAERPQKGRYRQFTQCDIDTLGVASPLVEIELILATCEALLGVGLSDLGVRINDRRILGLIARHCGFAEPAPGGFFIAFDKLDKIGAEGVVGELRAAGYDAAAVGRFERMLPTLATGASLEALRSSLGAGEAGEAFESLAGIIATANGALPAGARVRFDPTLVRGMGYYTGPIFEVASSAFPSSIAGGGRYDRMIGRLLGREVPASGFSIGFERLVLILLERGGEAAPAAAEHGPTRRVALLVDSAGDLAAALAAARALRAEGDLVSLELKRKNVARQLDDLARHGFSGYATCEPGGAVAVKPLAARREHA